MAAIQPHLGEELAPEDLDYQNARYERAPFRGLGRADAERGPTQGEIVGSLHAGLMELGTVRYMLETELAKQTLSVVLNEEGQPSIRVEPGIFSNVVPFRPMSRTSVTNVPLTSWTSKMGCPSFSIPAGHGELGGTCPGAAAGQSVVSPRARDTQEKFVLTVLNDPRFSPPNTAPIAEIDLAAAVCEHCYATGHNYLYADNAAYQMVKAAWVAWALEQPTESPYGLDGGPSNLFVDTMVAAIDAADYDHGGCEPPQWAASGWRFFRIHDSGDFGVGAGKSYFRAWKAIADCFAKGNAFKYQPIMFWAPTRMWAVPTWIDFVNEVNGGANWHGNFVVRASGYELNQHCPELRGRERSGWAAGSTVFSPDGTDAVVSGRAPRLFDWNCQAYAAKDGPTCRGALSPPLAGYEGGLIGCRACWMLPNSVINYTAH